LLTHVHMVRALKYKFFFVYFDIIRSCLNGMCLFTTSLNITSSWQERNSSQAWNYYGITNEWHRYITATLLGWLVWLMLAMCIGAGSEWQCFTYIMEFVVEIYFITPSQWSLASWKSIFSKSCAKVVERM